MKCLQCIITREITREREREYFIATKNRLHNINRNNKNNIEWKIKINIAKQNNQKRKGTSIIKQNKQTNRQAGKY